MSSAIIKQFVETGRLLLLLSSKMALKNRGNFTGNEQSVLYLTTAYAEAAKNAFQIVCLDTTLTIEERAKMAAIGAVFRRSHGVLKTNLLASPSFGASVITDLKPLAQLGPDGTAPGLAGYFGAPEPSPPISVTPIAEAALMALHRDILVLGTEPDTIVSLMATIADGVRVTA